MHICLDVGVCVWSCERLVSFDQACGFATAKMHRSLLLSRAPSNLLSVYFDIMLLRFMSKPLCCCISLISLCSFVCCLVLELILCWLLLWFVDS